MDLKFLELLRLLELEKVLSILSKINKEKVGQIRILEIGGGAGWQARALAEAGYSVESIDVNNTSNYFKDKVLPIIIYDGKNIPFPDEYFDIVFSSNVLAHIPHVISFQDEIKRVLKSDGVAIHVVPSGSWRIWTSVTHYLFIFKVIIKYLVNKLIFSRGYKKEPVDLVDKIGQLSKIELLKKVMFSTRLGEIGTAFTEIYHFSGYRWSNLFIRTGWKIDKICANKLFYTGYMIFGLKLSFRIRRYLSYILGSSCHIFVLRKR